MIVIAKVDPSLKPHFLEETNEGVRWVSDRGEATEFPEDRAVALRDEFFASGSRCILLTVGAADALRAVRQRRRVYRRPIRVTLPPDDAYAELERRRLA